MNVIRFTDTNFASRLDEMAQASSLFDKAIEERARTIIDAVYIRGDAALLEFSERFDGAKLRAEQLQVTKAELFNASLKADQELRDAVALAAKNIESFSRKSL